MWNLSSIVLATPRRTRFLLPALAVIIGLGATAAGAAPAAETTAGPAQDPALEAYALVRQWPVDPPPLAGLIEDPRGLDIDQADRAFISDRVVGGVVVMLPDGTFLPPFGAAGTSGPGRLGSPGRLAVDQENERLYVLDNGTDRVVAYDLGGQYLTAWNTPGVGIATAPDGRVFVADGQANEVKVFGPEGSPSFRFGTLGVGNGEFTLLTDVSVSPDGKVVAVGDKAGERIQLFDLNGSTVKFRRDWDLQRPEYSQYERNPDDLPPFFRCRAGTVFALGEDLAWVGDGSGSCRLRPDGFDYTLASSSVQGAVCKLSVVHPRLRPTTKQYLALATYDPNVGPCWSNRGRKDTRLDTTPVVLRFADEHLRRVAGVALATNEIPDGTLVGPWRIGLPGPGQVFLQDASTHSHLFDANGLLLADSGTGDVWKSGRSERTTLERVEGSPVPGEIFAHYRQENWGRSPGCGGCPPGWIERAQGIGRYRTVTAQVYGRNVLTVEPIWEKAWSKNSTEIQVHDIIYNRATDEIAALFNDSSSGTDLANNDALMDFFAADGVARPRTLDLDEIKLGRLNWNPYTDLGVTPTGQILVLDSARARVTVVSRDGKLAGTVAVGGDTYRVAGGPNDTLFALLRSGFVERRRLADGVVTARFDARSQDRSDPAALTDIAVDDAGQVHVVDGQSNQVLVFEPGQSTVALPSGLGECMYAAGKTASPERLALGDTTRISLQIAGRCGLDSSPTDVVIVTSGDVRALATVLGGLDMMRHRVGLIDVSPRLAQPLTHDRAAVIRAASNYGNATGASARLALEMAQKQFAADDGRQHVILLLKVPYCTPLLALDARECRGYAPAEEAAQAAAAAGTRVLVIINSYPGVVDHSYILASSVDAVIPEGADPIPYVIQYKLPEALAGNVHLEDGLPDNMRLVPGSVQPPATVAASALAWDLPRLPGEGAAFRFDLQPQAAGRWPTNTEAVATFTDVWGKPQRLVFPVPEVEVVDVAPTPVEPSPTTPPTATAPTAVPTPSPSATPAEARRPVFLPLLLRAFDIRSRE